MNLLDDCLEECLTREYRPGLRRLMIMVLGRSSQGELMTEFIAEVGINKTQTTRNSDQQHRKA